VFAALAAVTTGIPACVIVTPLIYAFALLVAYIINAISPLSPATWASLERLSEAIPRAVEAMDVGSTQRDIARVAAGAAVLVVPGAKFVLYKGASHVTSWDAPDANVKDVREFLRSVDKR